MGLYHLEIIEEPPIDVSTTELVLDTPEPDPEFPDEYYVQDDLELLDSEGIALEALHRRLGLEGMCLESARILDRSIPNYIRNKGGTQAFTSRPSLEGLADGAPSIKKRLMEIIASVRKYVADLYKRFKAWVVAKFSKPEATEVVQEVQQFVAKRQNKDAMTFMADLPDDPAKAAYELSTMMRGDTKAFTAECTNQLSASNSLMASIEKQLVENPIQFRLATGVLTVKELFAENSDLAVNQIFKKAADTADAAMKTRNYEEFKVAITNIDAVTAELQEFEKAFTVSEKPVPEQGEGKPVRLDTLFSNINTAAVDLQRVDIKAQVSKMTGGVQHIIDISENTQIEEIVEMIPEDVPEEQHSVMSQKIASLYRRIAKLGADVLRLWKMRADSVSTLNTVGNLLIKLVGSFEHSISACGSTLDDEQKEALVKALGAKGFTIAF